MTLLSCQNLTKSYGGRTLFTGISFGILKGDKIGIIGPNAAGKSTFLKILAGVETADSGNIIMNRSLQVAYVPQESVFPDETIEQIVINSFINKTMDEYEKQTQAIILLSKLGFEDTLIHANTLSGGWKKRLEMAKALAQDPDVLLLDEPTNHLDLEGILWLEEFLQETNITYMVISHDRYFLENITNRMIELNRAYPKGLFTTDGNYSNFLEQRETFLAGQKQQELSLSSTVRREIEWLKQNPKARTVKAQSRIKEANELIENLSELKSRNKETKNQIEFSSSFRETRKLLVATNLSKSLGNRKLFEHVSFTLSPGFRLGIIGINGSGKTTLLRLLMGEIQPDMGTIKYADALKMVYFDQHRAQLPLTTTLRRALAPENEMISFRGRSIHVNAWCKRFLFSPDRLDLPISQLSGGERARVHIARLMMQPADILLLDEPTNDLDIPTLEILEESLLDFPGAIVLISHDRYMLDSLSNVILGLGSDTDSTFFADYRQWEMHQEKIKNAPKIKVPTEAQQPSTKSQSSKKSDPAIKISYSEKREWEQMESNITSTEKAIQELEKEIDLAQKNDQTGAMVELYEKLHEKQHALEHLFKRWAELEKKINPLP